MQPCLYSTQPYGTYTFSHTDCACTAGDYYFGRLASPEKPLLSPYTPLPGHVSPALPRTTRMTMTMTCQTAS
eukprot:1160082-Pelagomonas_calceolata.AAC.1